MCLQLRLFSDLFLLKNKWIMLRDKIPQVSLHLKITDISLGMLQVFSGIPVIHSCCNSCHLKVNMSFSAAVALYELHTVVELYCVA